MKDVKIIPISLEDISLVEGCAFLYCEIWKEPPWNEGFWKEAEVIEDIKAQMKRAGALGFLAVFEEKVIGFTWGYMVSKEDMGEISGNSLLDFIFDSIKEVFYVDELGAAKEFRRHKVGTLLSQSLISSVRKLNAEIPFILRTDKKAVAARNLYKKLGFRDLQIEDSKHRKRTYWLLDK